MKPKDRINKTTTIVLIEGRKTVSFALPKNHRLVERLKEIQKELKEKRK